MYSNCYVLFIVLFAPCVSCGISEKLIFNYHVSSNYENFIQALISCKSAGMELVSINSAEEQENLEIFLKKYEYNEGYWLGGTNLGNGFYTWISNGKPLYYNKWLPNQPDNEILPNNSNRGENCIQWGKFNNSLKYPGWNDLVCQYKLKFICQEMEYCSIIK